MFTYIKAFLVSKQQKGQGLVEYAILLVFIAIVTIVVVQALGGKIVNVFQQIVDAL